MAKYRKKPVEVDAEQFNGKPITGVCYCGDKKPHVHTIHNNQRCDIVEGDWIVSESNGLHFYPVKPAIFLLMYEPVLEDQKPEIFCPICKSQEYKECSMIRSFSDLKGTGYKCYICAKCGCVYSDGKWIAIPA